MGKLTELVEQTIKKEQELKISRNVNLRRVIERYEYFKERGLIKDDSYTPIIHSKLKPSKHKQHSFSHTINI